MGATGYTTDPRAVTSVNTEVGAVVLTASEVGADASGAATTAVSTHAGATDPHADRAFTTTSISTHAAATDPHADRAFTTSAVSTHAGATDPHGDRAFTTSAISTHAGATDPHGDRAYADTGLAGKAATAHVHAGTDITTGTVDVARLPTGATGTTVALGNHTHGVATGGTGVASVTAGSYLKGAGTSALVERTPAQVLSEIAALPLAGGTITGDTTINALFRMTAAPVGNLSAPVFKLTLDHAPLTSEEDVWQVWQTQTGVAHKTAWKNERGHGRDQQWSFGDHLVVWITDPDNSTADPVSVETQTVGQVGRTKVGAITGSGRIKTSMYSWTTVSSFGANYAVATTDGYGNSVDSLAVRLVSDDTVEFRGGVVVGASSSTNSETMFTLPASTWYPAKSRPLNLYASSSIAVPGLVRASGATTIQRAAVTTGTVVMLDGWQYRL